jgi:hypothetical protein
LAGVIDRRGESFELPASRPQVGQSWGRSWAAPRPANRRLIAIARRNLTRFISTHPLIRQSAYPPYYLSLSGNEIHEL